MYVCKQNYSLELTAEFADIRKLLCRGPNYYKYIVVGKNVLYMEKIQSECPVNGTNTVIE
jgi:hypothetical protein